MKRWLSHLTITCYLAVIGFGLISHAVEFRAHNDPAMYFIVWDMYSGWSAYETRMHLLGQGQSGAFYDLSIPPWGEFLPFGEIGRRHYDVRVQFVGRLADLTLRHTVHEPMQRIVVVEEAWSKKYNLPDHLWNRRFAEPREPYSYCHVRAVLSAEGKYLQRSPEWPTLIANYGLMNNPRLRSDISRGHAFVAVDPTVEATPVVTPASYQTGLPSGF